MQGFIRTLTSGKHVVTWLLVYCAVMGHFVEVLQIRVVLSYSLELKKI